MSARLQGLDKPTRVIRLREESDKLGVEAHTLRRYLVLRSFLERLGVADEEAVALPIGPMEVILRIWNRDPSVAANTLRMLRAGRLTFRRALELERGLRLEGSQRQAGEGVTDELATSNRGRVARALQISPQTLEERSQLEDPRFDLVQAQAVYVAAGKTVAFLDEEAFVGAGVWSLVRFAREVLLAANLYDVVVVGFALKRSRAAFEDCLKLAKGSVVASIILLDDDVEPILSGETEPSA